MRRYLMPISFLVIFFVTLNAVAQTVTISGNVQNVINKEAVPAVSVIIKGFPGGTFTDDRGNFRLSTSKSFPIILVVSSIGYETQDVSVGNSAFLQIEVKPASTLGQEIVVSASRIAQRILESPVSIERVSASAIRSAPASSYYDVLTNLKGVDMTTSSLTFKTPSTRGFNTSGNERLNQLVDGMDNQAPGLNFSVGSVIGLTELDVDNMELLPGASSALYGSGGMNGTLLITSKNPFKYQGFSFQAKEGAMNVDGRERSISPYNNVSFRWAFKTSDRLAFKVGAEFTQAKDWLGDDTRDYNRATGQIVYGNRNSDPNYDGINVYGDETTIDIMRNVLLPISKLAPFLAPYIYSMDTTKPINVSRTGYNEKYVVSPNTVNFKVSGALHYKLTPNTEAVLEGYLGTGNTVYTGADRYSLRNLKMAQYKVELTNKNWFLRAYTTQENAGNSYDATVTTRLFNEAWKPSEIWYEQYAEAYLGALEAGQSNINAHNYARSVADVGRPVQGSAQFNEILDSVRSRPIKDGGGRFIDKTDLYSAEGQYNLTQFTGDFAEVLVGANFKRYELNSEGTLFADSAGKIGTNEFGAYAQVSKKFFDDFLRLTVSGRYDKNQNFQGHFTPRATAVVRLNENNNIRLSFQTAYRFPTNQNQWINLVVGGNEILIGGIPALRNFYDFNNNPVYSESSVLSGNPQIQLFGTYKPESVVSYEAGYKSLAADGRLLIDLYGYYAQNHDLLSRTTVIQSKTGDRSGLSNSANWTIFSVSVNAPGVINSYGYGLSLDYRLPSNFVIGVNGSSDVLQKQPPNFVTYFDAPKYRANASFGNTGFGRKRLWSFDIVLRWQDAIPNYEADFANGSLPSIRTLDAQISYKIPNIKSVIKIGATNLLNQYYTDGVGNSDVGGLYYVGFAYNVF
ncbi:MAG TPA: TonB-dependent receptor [Puia sp.]|nr:TonB-dependent receptor [Puia sp.]